MPTRRATKKEANNGDYVEVDKVGEVDGDVEQMDEIELSSDDEDDDDDCALIVLKRPPVTERTIEEVEGVSIKNKVLIFEYIFHCYDR